ncbi:ribonuclease H-like domain-containing protein [Pseudomonadota bacterium]
MNLKSRLSTLKRQSGLAVAEELSTPSVPTPSLAERLLRHRTSQPTTSLNKPKDDDQLATMVGGKLIHPGVIKIEKRIPLSESHGAVPLQALKASSIDFPEYADLNINRCLFFDTETTGLSGGTGTLVFMLGMGRVEGDAFVVCQLMLTSFAGEAKFLKEAEQWANEAKYLVSFNGKSFDSPLLNSRYRLKGERDPFADKIHIDLLYSVRRAYANKWPDCRLGTTERKLLKFKRTDDLPGVLAPEAWLSYVRFGQTEMLPKVAEHNYWDIVSLAALIPALADVFAAPHQNDADVLCIARFYWKRHQVNRAKQTLESCRSVLNNEALLELANMYRQLRCWKQACEIWKKLARQGCTESPERLAKYYEHVRKDYSRALQYAGKLPTNLGSQQRIARLNHRLQGQGCLF